MLAELGPLVLVGPPGRPPSRPEAFQYATSHSRPEDGRAGPMAQLLDSVVLPLAKKPNAPFPDVLIVGRARTSDVCIDDVSVSKLHARIAIGADAKLRLVDARSTNGTFLGQQRLAPGEQLELSPGQSFRFGDRDFRVHDPKLLLASVANVSLEQL